MVIFVVVNDRIKKSCLLYSAVIPPRRIENLVCYDINTAYAPIFYIQINISTFVCLNSNLSCLNLHLVITVAS